MSKMLTENDLYLGRKSLLINLNTLWEIAASITGANDSSKQGFLQFNIRALTSISKAAYSTIELYVSEDGDNLYTNINGVLFVASLAPTKHRESFYNALKLLYPMTSEADGIYKYLASERMIQDNPGLIRYSAAKAKIKSHGDIPMETLVDVLRGFVFPEVDTDVGAPPTMLPAATKVHVQQTVGVANSTVPVDVVQVISSLPGDKND